ncbi:hypothetical protein NDU88_007317 [Pleurodeles waltl]|uniref:Uncharacterized protein n=1 Tax=Pleurodeles waltl TaxID=8319 RepID=A0AAV7UNH4_PLEWA|nr:hypothetical protein NDU88_007317 [Pleurodeles waltl]
MAMARWQERKKTEGWSRRRMRIANQRKKEGWQCVDEDDRGTKTKPQRLKETENQRRTEAQRIQFIEEGEDAQSPATFCGRVLSTAILFLLFSFLFTDPACILDSSEKLWIHTQGPSLDPQIQALDPRIL